MKFVKTFAVASLVALSAVLAAGTDIVRSESTTQVTAIADTTAKGGAALYDFGWQ